jgi:hypothetical protein
MQQRACPRICPALRLLMHSRRCVLCGVAAKQLSQDAMDCAAARTGTPYAFKCTERMHAAHDHLACFWPAASGWLRPCAASWCSPCCCICVTPGLPAG